MKHILAPILLMVFLFPALALGEEVVTWDDLQQRDVGYCKKGTDAPFTGKITGIAEGSFKNGEKEGPWVRYHDNGQSDQFYSGTYKNGVKVD